MTEELVLSGDPKKSFEGTNQFSERVVNMSKNPFLMRVSNCLYKEEHVCFNLGLISEL